jgi:hypothetical protein
MDVVRHLIVRRREAWPDGEFVQQAVALLPWGHRVFVDYSSPASPWNHMHGAAAAGGGAVVSCFVEFDAQNWKVLI